MKSKRDVAAWVELSRQDPQGCSEGVVEADMTWISPAHKYFCLAIPKVACSKVKVTLQQLEGYPLPNDVLQVHFRATPGIPFLPSLSDFTANEAADILTSPDWFRFSFVRNPYARLFSAYKSQVMDLASPYVGFRESIREEAGYPTKPGGTPGMVGFGDFVRYMGGQSDRERDGHWRSQTRLLCLEAISYDFIGRFESFAHDFVHILEQFQAPAKLVSTVSHVINATPRLPLAAVYDKGLADYVYDVFRDDFEVFAYEKDSWMTDC